MSGINFEQSSKVYALLGVIVVVVQLLITIATYVYYSGQVVTEVKGEIAALKELTREYNRGIERQLDDHRQRIWRLEGGATK